MIRLGLCCIFRAEPIKFRTTTAKRLSGLGRDEQLQILGEICLHNALTLKEALDYCLINGIGDFRVQSQINPLRTHPSAGYQLEELPDYRKIIEIYRECRQFNKENNIRTTFHPDQFIVLSTPYSEVLQASLAELNYQAEIAEFIGADVINIHAGGVYGDKPAALERLKKQLELLPDRIRSRITLENDDRNYTVSDLHTLCKDLDIPLVYDVHHHRCLSDGLTVEEATALSLKTWNREPLFHISSPKEGWNNASCQYHHDYIAISDFPDIWQELDITVEIEAKAKELAIKKLKEELSDKGVGIRLPGN